jgi:catechol 2,3-dioxygenase-like lactoylglutathione lyase family enzyme
MRFERLLAIRLVSHDAEALAGFYTAALGFRRGPVRAITNAELAQLTLDGGGRRIGLVLGEQTLEIDQFDRPGWPYPSPRASDDDLFQHFAIVTSDMPAAWSRVLAAGGLPISPHGPVQLPPANGSVTAAKFRDPEGHPLELLAFPPDGVSQHRFAIDHSAIVVRNLEASMAFYAAHGLTAGERTINHGVAQAALDGLTDPQVAVVSLLPPGQGPHLELLGYRDPAPRAQLPWLANDVAATRLVWQAVHGSLLRDPDGHLHQRQLSDMPNAS